MINKYRLVGSALVSVAMTIALAGCGTTTSVARGSAAAVASEEQAQKAAYLKTTWERQARLENVAWPLLTAGKELCGEDVRQRVGLSVISIEMVGKDNQQVARQFYGVSESPKILHVTAGSPAALAGLKEGDKLLSIGGQPVASGRKATERAVELLLEAAGTGNPFEITVSRGGVTLPTIVEPQLACRYPVLMVQDDALNAFADGNAVYITTGMYRFAENDRELQLVIAHEIAHNSEGHSDKKMMNWGLGTLLDIAAAAYGVNTQGAFGDMTAKAYSQDFEREADYVGMYILANAEIDTSDVANFWRRMAAEYPQSIKGSYSASHPASAERWTNIEAAHREVVAKQTSGTTLLPERKH